MGNLVEVKEGELYYFMRENPTQAMQLCEYKGHLHARSNMETSHEDIKCLAREKGYLTRSMTSRHFMQGAPFTCSFIYSKTGVIAMTAEPYVVT